MNSLSLKEHVKRFLRKNPKIPTINPDNYYVTESGQLIRKELSKLEKGKQQEEKIKYLEKAFDNASYLNDKLLTRILELEDEISDLKDNYNSDKKSMTLIIEKGYKLEVKAKQIVRKLLGLYFSPIITNKDLEMQDEIIKEAKEFLN